MSCQRAVAQDTLCLAREPRPPGKVGLLIWLSLVADRWVCLLPFTPSHMCKEGRRYVRSTGNCLAPPKSRKNQEKLISETPKTSKKRFGELGIPCATHIPPAVFAHVAWSEGKKASSSTGYKRQPNSKATLQDLMCLAPSWEMRVCIKIIILFQ